MTVKAFVIFNLVVLLLLAGSIFCQVAVTVKTNKTQYLASEPIFILIEVKNIGTEPIGYSRCDSDIDLTVVGVVKEQPPRLRSCFSLDFKGVSRCLIDHPPLMSPDQTISFDYLLKGYRLPAGGYILHAKGKAGVRWKYYRDMRPNAPPAPPHQHREGDPVQGEMFDVQFALSVKDGNTVELKEVFAPYVADARDGIWSGAAGRGRRSQKRHPSFWKKRFSVLRPTPAVPIRQCRGCNE